MSAYIGLARLKSLFTPTPSTFASNLPLRAPLRRSAPLLPRNTFSGSLPTRKWYKPTPLAPLRTTTRPSISGSFQTRSFAVPPPSEDSSWSSIHANLSPSQIFDIIGRDGVHSSAFLSLSSSPCFDEPVRVSAFFSSTSSLLSSALVGFGVAILVISGTGGVSHAESEPSEEVRSPVLSSAVVALSPSSEEVSELIEREVRSNFWPVLMREWKMLLLAIVLTFASSLAELYSMRVGGGVIDSALTKNFEVFMKRAWQLCGAVAMQGVLQFVSYAFLTRATERVRARLSELVFESVIYQDKSFFDGHNSSELMQRLSADVTNIRDVVKHTISLGVKSSTSIVGGMAAAWTKSPSLALLIAAAIGTAVTVGSLYARLLRRLSRASKAANSRALACATEATAAVTTVQAFGGEEREITRHNLHLQSSVHKSQQFGAALGFFKGISTAGVSGILVGVLLYGGHLVQIGQLSIGDLSSFIVVASSIQSSLGHVAQLVGQLAHGRDAVQRVFEIIDATPTINPKRTVNRVSQGAISTATIKQDYTETKAKQKVKEGNGSVKLEHVSFAYANRPDMLVLKDVNITLEEGKTLSLVGHSGSGKSTISRLLLRFYDPVDGIVSLDGEDIKTLDPHWLRSQIGIVEQEPVLFGGTIWENIAYGRPGATREEILLAAKSANCADFIDSFPLGYDTVVGERGAQLSGGQKQRIAIARAILKNPRILILDEATSALDATTETLVQEALNNLMKNRTTLIIAHRLSTIKNSDTIVVIDHGRVVETGNHESLSQSKGYYSKLIDQQRLSGRTPNELLS